MRNNKNKLLFYMFFFNALLAGVSADTYNHIMDCTTACGMAEINQTVACNTSCSAVIMNASGYYDKAATDALFNTSLQDYYTKEQMDMRFAIVQWNLTTMDNRSDILIEGKLEDYQDNLSTTAMMLEDIFDSKIDRLKGEFIEADEFNASVDAKTAWIQDYVESRTAVFDRIGLYFVIGIFVLVGGFYAVNKYKPDAFRGFFRVTGQKTYKRHSKSVIDDDEYKKQINRQRDLKVLVSKKKVSKNIKAKLYNLIDEDKIQNSEDITKYVDIEKAVE